VKTIHEEGNELLSGNFWSKISRNILNFSFSSGSIASEDWVGTGPAQEDGRPEQEGVKKIHEEGNELLSGNFCCKISRNVLNFSFSSGSRIASFHLSVELQILLERTEKTALEGELGPSGELQR
jgi:hypothetical protein